MNCKNCAFFEPANKVFGGGDEGNGECRINPPHIGVVTATSRHSVIPKKRQKPNTDTDTIYPTTAIEHCEGQVTYEQSTRFPIVDVTDWCGKWAPKIWKTLIEEESIAACFNKTVALTKAKIHEATKAQGKGYDEYSDE